MSIVTFIAMLHLIVPIMGIIWLGIRQERKRQEELLRRSIMILNNRRRR